MTAGGCRSFNGSQFARCLTPRPHCGSRIKRAHGRSAFQNGRIEPTAAVGKSLLVLIIEDQELEACEAVYGNGPLPCQGNQALIDGYIDRSVNKRLIGVLKYL